MEVDDPRLAALLASRICHDLISPLGAVSNGLELVEMAVARDLPELSLAREAVAAANGRLRFFRLSFGNAAPGEQIARSEILSVLEARFAPTRIGVAWDSAASVARVHARMCLLAILCLEAALPRGGHVTVAQRARGWHLRARGPRLSATGPGWQIVGGAATSVAPTASEVPFLLLATHAGPCGLSVEAGGDAIEIRLGHMDTRP